MIHAVSYKMAKVVVIPLLGPDGSETLMDGSVDKLLTVANEFDENES